MFRELEPRFQGCGLGTAAGGDGGGRGGLVDHPGGEFNEGGGAAADAFASEGEGESGAAGSVDGVVLGVAGFATAIEDVGVLRGVEGGEDCGEGFCVGGRGLVILDGREGAGSGVTGKDRNGRERCWGDKRSRVASACMNLSWEHASANSGASQASWGRTLSTRRTSEARLFLWI